jgi:hypothetical protein
VVRTLKRTEEEEEEIPVLEVRVIASQMLVSGRRGEWEMRVLVIHKNGDACVWHLSGVGEEVQSLVQEEEEEMMLRGGGGEAGDADGEACEREEWSLESSTKVATFSIPRRLLLQLGSSSTAGRRGSTASTSSASFALDGYWIDVAARRMGTWTGSNVALWDLGNSSTGLVLRHGKFVKIGGSESGRRSRAGTDVDLTSLKHKTGVSSTYTHVVGVNHDENGNGRCPGL